MPADIGATVQRAALTGLDVVVVGNSEVPIYNPHGLTG